MTRGRGDAESAISQIGAAQARSTHGVAFFRNLNNGQRGDPSGDDIREAFREVGASGVRLVRGNGTVVFAGEFQCALAAARLLIERSTWDDIVLVRGVEWVDDRLNGLLEAKDRSRIEFTLFDEQVTATPPIRGRRCEVLEGGAGYAVIVNSADRVSDGTPTIERALGVKATSRGLSTMRMIQSGASNT